MPLRALWVSAPNRAIWCDCDLKGSALRFCCDLKRGSNHKSRDLKVRLFSPKRKFSAGHPCGHPAKSFGQALQILEKQAFRNGHPTRTSMKKLRSEKLRADFSFPKLFPVPALDKNRSPTIVSKKAQITSKASVPGLTIQSETWLLHTKLCEPHLNPPVRRNFLPLTLD